MKKKYFINANIIDPHNGINENDVIVFNKFEDADNYVNGLEGSPRIIETELK